MDDAFALMEAFRYDTRLAILTAALVIFSLLLMVGLLAYFGVWGRRG